MPQLMPLGWVLSVFMIMFFLAMSLILYYKGSESLEIKFISNIGGNVYWLW